MMSALWTLQGREYRPTPADLTPGWALTPEIERGVWQTDPGVTRIIGAIERPLLLATGEQVEAVLLCATGDPDGAEWKANSFHGTSAVVLAPEVLEGEGQGMVWDLIVKNATWSQAYRAKKRRVWAALCGAKGCHCGTVRG